MTRATDERGSILVTVMIVGAVLAVVAGSLARGSIADLGQGQRSQATNRSLQAAEAGIDDYIAKLTQDHLYYAHRTHAGEATRVPAGGGAPVGAGQVWTGTLDWTYPNGADVWVGLGDGLEYDLRIAPPSAQQRAVRIVATGRQVGAPTTAHTLEALVRTASIADFQMMSNTDITYGTTAITEGKVYANGNVVHNGTIYEDVYAEKQIYRTDSNGNRIAASPNYQPKATSPTGELAKGYTPGGPNNIRTVSGLKGPIDFAGFIRSVSDVKLAANPAAGGITLDQPSVKAWWLTFNATGTVTESTCAVQPLPIGLTAVSMTSYTKPTCTAVATVPLPSNGAIYVEQTTIVSGVVRGRVTVSSPNVIAVGDNLSYKTGGTDGHQGGVDVLGLIAGSIQVPQWAPAPLAWRAATLATTGKWTTMGGTNSVGLDNNTPPQPDPAKSTMLFVGSTATFDGGAMSQYGWRTYRYDTTLQYLQPPYFPVLEDAWTIQLLREIRNF